MNPTYLSEIYQKLSVKLVHDTHRILHDYLPWTKYSKWIDIRRKIPLDLTRIVYNYIVPRKHSWRPAMNEVIKSIIPVDDAPLDIFAVNYNIFRIAEGMSSLRFSL